MTTKASRLHLPQPPSIASALSGFVIGVVATLFATGVFNVGGSGSSSPTLPSPTATTSDFYSRVQHIVTRQLGPGYPNPQRLILLQLLPVRSSGDQVPTTDGRIAVSQYKSLYIEYRLLDHPLRSWRLSTARSEVFTLLKALYTSGLAIYSVELDGQFTLPVRGGMREQRALVAYIDRSTAARIPWRAWGRDHELQVWNVLPFKSVDPRFA